ncbi:hypothetical protein [Streptomyces jumonjinensis]|uniref:hypothetical protein n=1 Tax=Streptomyces jumonjinensis TaxID=1945 RepID=UPI001E28474D|nr:hypothetical protein [Streptomyces jumonjinensis]
MDVRGYKTGPIEAEAAFTSDFPLDDRYSTQDLVDMLERERPNMDIRPGMRHKYTPLRFDPATGVKYIGGRYLFDTWENVLDYNHFTNEELFPEPGVKFWSRFPGVDRHYWKVTGAHDFKPMATSHHINRFERYSYTDDSVEQLLKQVWPAIRDEAEKQGLSSVWLMFQPEEKQIGIITVAEKAGDADQSVAISKGLEYLERLDAFGRFLPAQLGAEQLMDRTSLIISSWLPESRALGGAPVRRVPAAPEAADLIVAPDSTGATAGRAPGRNTLTVPAGRPRPSLTGLIRTDPDQSGQSFAAGRAMRSRLPGTAANARSVRAISSGRPASAGPVDQACSAHRKAATVISSAIRSRSSSAPGPAGPPSSAISGPSGPRRTESSARTASEVSAQCWRLCAESAGVRSTSRRLSANRRSHSSPIRSREVISARWSTPRTGPVSSASRSTSRKAAQNSFSGASATSSLEAK